MPKEHRGRGNCLCKCPGAGVSLGQCDWSRGLDGEIGADGRVRSLGLLHVQQALSTDRLNPHTPQS